ncbi:translation initiation factor IF-6 [Hyperthermus butylicus]|uniref:Translation initiation factor 6 n=1 Tax=Hyperthermus butylicus (strain DSM 5456 / JCM 9403 / PLM1-5) TaxID=415426 RepID=IF6_HYPBU|nr:translation initiation factor IF-6 [Hyperthermus butylicus]A2BN57.1 RecName: Full=Translation initiation factor 6; Short=aIF-6 [Hyperthermus butylicus DSM 5456]ABM81418.1 translation initiation factor 6 (eIF-6) [Hyperthermus butylicus DSM 5456]
MIEYLNVHGNPNIGVYIYANNKIALVPPTLTEKDKKKIEETLGVEVIETKIADMIINGVMIAGNDNGLLLPRIVKPEELDYLREHIGDKVRLEILEVRQTALGNLIAANNRGALVSPLIDKAILDKIKSVLGVETIYQRHLANIPTVGSMIVVTNRGGVVHPGVSDDEIRILNSVFGVEFTTATVNFGLYFVKAGLVANDHGALVGDETTGPELMRIQQALRLRG